MESGAQFKRLGYLLLLIAAVFGIACVIQGLYFQHTLHSFYQGWLIGSVFLFSLLNTQAHPVNSVPSLIITGLTAAFAVFLFSLAAFSVPVLLILIFVLTFACIYLRIKYPSWFLPACIVGILVLAACSLQVTLTENSNRFFWMVIGLAVVVLLQTMFAPSKKTLLELAQRQVLTNLKNLNKVIFSCLLDAEYIDNVYLYERRLHLQKIRYFRSFQQMQNRLALNKSTMTLAAVKKVIDCGNKLDSMFNNMMDYAQLRKRVSDYTTLSVCSMELKEICAAIDMLLNEIKNFVSEEHFDWRIKKLNQKINNLEDNYHHVLQVASREPLVFLLFINSLRQFSEQGMTLTHLKRCLS